jgi:hypothetical protein
MEDSSLLLPALGIFFSKTYQFLIDMKMPRADETQSGTHSRSYEVGVVQDLPWPSLQKADVDKLSVAVGSLVNAVQRTNSVEQTTKVALHPPLCSPLSLHQSTLKWHRQHEAACVDQLANAEMVEESVASMLSIPTDYSALSSGDARILLRLPCTEPGSTFNEIYRRAIHETIREELNEGGGNRQVAVNTFYVSRRIEVLTQSLGIHPAAIARWAAQRDLLPYGLVEDESRNSMCYLFGCVLGRWDIRYATGEYPPPKLSDPFDPLPVCSPGMLRGPDGLPARQTPEGYPFRIDWDGILVDDPDHDDDIVRRVRDVLDVIWKDRADAIEKEACETLGVADLRDYFRKPGPGGFWDDHVKRYSKSRRKAPIYWLLQSSKKNYALWVYYHRLDKDILFKALLNYVEPKIRKEEARLDELRSQKAALGSAAKGVKKLDKDIDRQDAFLSELRDFEDKLRRAANLHLDPDLNDGVVLNIAPLRELVPWKEARSYWDDLMGGKYEWSSIGKQLREKGLVTSQAT